MIHDKKFITANGTTTSQHTFDIIEGLQQGTVNSPILFNIFTSDIHKVFALNDNNNTYSITYADDKIAYVADTTIVKVKDTLQTLTDKINNYYTIWNLRINPNKCETILFTNPENLSGANKKIELDFKSPQSTQTPEKKYQYNIKKQLNI